MVISLFMLLIYTEIIELHFCKLDFYIKKNIAKRAGRITVMSDDSYDIGGGILIEESNENTDKDNDEVSQEKKENQEIILSSINE